MARYHSKPLKCWRGCPRLPLLGCVLLGVEQTVLHPTVEGVNDQASMHLTCTYE